MSDETHRYCTFRLADYYIGIEVMRVQEVLRAQETTSVPLTQSVVGGLMNLRGEIVTTIDLRSRLGLEPFAGSSMNVVIRTGEGVVSLLVDEIDDVIEVTDDSFEPPPSTLQASLRDLLIGVFKLDRQLLLVIDVDQVMSLPPEDVLVANAN